MFRSKAEDPIRDEDQNVENLEDARHTTAKLRTPEQLEIIRTKPGMTNEGKPFDHYVERQVAERKLRLESIPSDALGTARPLEVYRAERKGKFIKPWESGADDTSYCPARWEDISIGLGACGYRCRSCFLMLTQRTKCDPSRHVLYENVHDYERAVRKALRRPGVNLGLGIDCSDSLLYEGVTGHARRLIPLFADPETNPHGRKLILLTKSANVHYLAGLPSENVLVTFSLNPEQIADLWEGKWNDGVRITPPIDERLAASARAGGMGFEVRWRIDPILPVDGWEDIYREFFDNVAAVGHAPTRITLGTYREMGTSLRTFAARWGLPPMEWTPQEKLTRDGPHYHLSLEDRIATYRGIVALIESSWKGRGSAPIVALCKETSHIRAAVGIEHTHCNCE